ncbi:prepilin peptidase [Vermiphilus pyriformis]|nr:MAG: prepilin peptidase [Vermiphilus pyriformis]
MYSIFFSALIVSIRTDLECMLLSRFTTLYLIPIGFIGAYFDLLPITLLQSIIGCFLGYTILYLIAQLYRLRTGIEGMGQGDLELLGMIGSFLGPLGCWLSLCVAAILGSIVSLGYIALHTTCDSRNVRIPFGPFLACGAFAYVFYKTQLITFFLHNLAF